MSEPFLPYGRQTIEDDDVDAVVRVLRGEMLTTGPAVPAFEEAFAARVGARHAVAVCNGTAALHTAMHCVGIGPGDEVIVPAITFLATANAVRYVGARVVFADVDPESGLVRAEDIDRAFTSKTRAIMAVHMNGAPVALDSVHGLAESRGVKVIEDAAHALGATHAGRPIGSMAGVSGRSDAVTFSFHPVKHLTTAEGGAITTDDDELAHRMRRFRNHGMEREPARLERPSPGPWYYEQQELGFNYRLNDVQCALGLSQLSKLDRFVARRREIAALYDDAFAGMPHVRPTAGCGEPSESAWHLYAVLVDFSKVGRSRAEIMDALRGRGIGTQVHYEPIPTQPDWQRAGASMEGLDGAARYAARVLSLPMFPAMQDADVRRVVRALGEVLAGD